MTDGPAARPDVLFILADDLGAWALGSAGNPEIRTPNLDRLAGRGVRFGNFFCVSPVCSPARASILTGRIPSRHGVHDWLSAGNSTVEPAAGGRLIRYLEGQPGYPESLARTGYLCGLSGKWHLGDAHHPQMGFSFWETHARGGGPYYGAPMIRDGAAYEEPRYVTDVITDNALRFLEENAGGGRPLYLGVHYTAPHSPWGREHHPAGTYDDYLANCPFRSVPDLPMHPWQTAGISRPRPDAPPERVGQERRELLSGYFTAVTEMDRNIGRLVDWLESRGRLERTLVFFTGDNGMNLGHHGVWGKGNGTLPLNMYEESVKVPFIAAGPGLAAGGAVCDELLSHYDFMPTLLDLLGVEGPGDTRLPGRSFAPLLRGEGDGGRDRLVVFDEYGPTRMIRTERWKLVRRFPAGPDELYDLAADPGEERNLAGRPERARIAAELCGELDEWFRAHADPEVDGRGLPVTGSGQIEAVGPAGGGRTAFNPPHELLAAKLQNPA